jgi:hypothetical protein
MTLLDRLAMVQPQEVTDFQHLGPRILDVEDL